VITGKLYDWLKYIAQIVLPGLGTLYFTLAGVWNLSSGDQVVGTIMAVDLFLGVLLGISQVNYNKQVGTGEMHVEEAGDGLKKFSLELAGSPEELPGMKEVRFKIKEGEVQNAR
jgi:imidazoleglycerol phosphate synthase glutamine amidotransferase subunit HisH